MQRELAKGTRQGTEAFKDQKAALNRLARQYRTMQRETLGLSTAQKGLTDSTRNMIRSYASLFALFEGTQAINHVVTSLEGAQAAMKLTADTTEGVAANMNFVTEESARLGLNIGETAKAFVRLASAAKGKLELEDVKEIFLGTAEAATVSQLSQDDMAGALRAVVQIH